MTVYKAVANEAVVTLDLAKAMLAGDTVDESLIEKSGWDFECAYDTESYETSEGNKCPSFLPGSYSCNKRQPSGSTG